MRLPNKNRFTQFLLFLMFMCGVAMVVFPMLSQQREIAEDDSLYAMLAQEMQAAMITEPEATERPEIIEAQEPPDTTADEPFGVDDADIPDASEETPDVSEADALEIADVIPSEEPIPEPEEEPAMIVSYPSPSAEPVQASPTASPVPTKPAASPKPTSAPESTAVQNKDYVAWLSIPGTVINYPVVRSDRTDYYLHHLITGQQSKLGTLFSLKTSDYETPSKNIAIYGHHLSNSTAMFSTLLEYKKESYWKSHQTIQLNTIYGKRTYRIFAVLNHTVSDWDASTASFKDDAAFLKFINRAKKKAFYDTGIEVSETDNIITLITCDRSFGGVQGRLLVMGVEQ
ncbi:MAG: sortase [Clostridia bacterium]|nr:sortase [Clostridia bacterium]